MTEIKTIWTEQVPVRSHETDFLELWKPASFFQAMQESATHHASHFGFDYPTMLARETIWILSRAKVKFLVFPHLGDEIIIQTWPKGLQQKVFFMRDFKFSSPSGKVFAVATSAWVLINPKARRMLLPNALDGKVPDNNGLSALDETLEKIDLPDKLEQQSNLVASYSAVDLMGHVNNARYVEWICDCFSFETYVSQKMDWLQINFNHEIKAGEHVSILTGQYKSNPTLWAIQGINQSTSFHAFDALVKWR